MATADLSLPHFRLPCADVDRISGLLDLLREAGGRSNVSRIAKRWQLDLFNTLLPTLQASALLGFAEVAQGDVTMTPLGRVFAEASFPERRALFQRQVLLFAPLVGFITRILERQADGMLPADCVMDILSEYYPRTEAEQQFATAATWGCYAELFAYDTRAKQFRVLKVDFANTTSQERNGSMV